MSGRTGRRRPLVDVDAVARARLLHAAAWSAFAGAFIGIAFVIAVGPLAGVLAAVVVTVLATAGALAVAELAGGATRMLHAPSVGSRPKGLSRAEALRARGEPDLAVAELEALAARDPRDPEPALLLAEVHRDDRGDLDEAIRWFRAARDRATPDSRLELLVWRALIATLRRRGETAPAPELARMAERFRGRPEGNQAAAELAEIKARMARPER